MTVMNVIVTGNMYIMEPEDLDINSVSKPTRVAGDMSTMYLMMKEKQIISSLIVPHCTLILSPCSPG